MSKAIREGCVVTFERPYFTGSYRNAKYQGSALITGEVTNDSYGYETNKHTFTILISKIDDVDNVSTHTVGNKIRVQGKNLYPNVTHHIQGIIVSLSLI